MNEIHVDDYVYNNRTGRYRFSLAHELGHRILHSEIWEQFCFDGILEWREFHQNAIPEREYDFLEYHADCFAGLILVPSNSLQTAFLECISLLRDRDHDIETISDVVRTIIEGHLAPIFEVSRAVIHKRLEKDKLWDSI